MIKKMLFLILCLVAMSQNIFGINPDVLNSSLEEKEINDKSIEVLRVRSRKIDSPAKDIIIDVQKQLDKCYRSIKREHDISDDLNKIRESIQNIKKNDQDWPISYYSIELTINCNVLIIKEEFLHSSL